MRLGSASVVGGILLAFMAARPAWADAVPVLNNSFESPVVPLQDIAFPGATDWTTSPGVGAGVFPNLPMDMDFGGIVAKRITNADGSQLAFINALFDPTGITDNGTPIKNEFSQQLAATYQAGQAYTLSVGVTTSSVQPPSPGTKLRLELYYPSNGQLVPVAFTLVDAADASQQNQMLKYYTVQTPVVDAGAAYAGQPIGVLLSTADNGPSSGGTFDMDNVTVNSVPEPASIAFVGLAAVLCVRRRPRMA
jgi:hypothetical protein